MDDKIINQYIKCYLIGPMEHTNAKDEGRGWRDRLRPELENRVDVNGNPVYVFDPTLHEEKKVGCSPKEFHKKLDGWIASGNRDKLAEAMEIIWKGKTFLTPSNHGMDEELVHIMGDVDYVIHSNFLILHMEEKDRPCGTYGEAFFAYHQNIPIYLIQTMPLNKYSKTLLGWVLGSGGEIFDNKNSY